MPDEIKYSEQKDEIDLPWCYTLLNSIFERFIETYRKADGIQSLLSKDAEILKKLNLVLAEAQNFYNVQQVFYDVNDMNARQYLIMAKAEEIIAKALEESRVSKSFKESIVEAVTPSITELQEIIQNISEDERNVFVLVLAALKGIVQHDEWEVLIKRSEVKQKPTRTESKQEESGKLRTEALVAKQLLEIICAELDKYKPHAPGSFSRSGDVESIAQTLKQELLNCKKAKQSVELIVEDVRGLIKYAMADSYERRPVNRTSKYKSKCGFEHCLIKGVKAARDALGSIDRDFTQLNPNFNKLYDALMDVIQNNKFAFEKRKCLQHVKEVFTSVAKLGK